MRFYLLHSTQRIIDMFAWRTILSDSFQIVKNNSIILCLKGEGRSKNLGNFFQIEFLWVVMKQWLALHQKKNMCSAELILPELSSLQSQQVHVRQRIQWYVFWEASGCLLLSTNIQRIPLKSTLVGPICRNTWFLPLVVGLSVEQCVTVSFPVWSCIFKSLMLLQRIERKHQKINKQWLPLRERIKNKNKLHS